MKVIVGIDGSDRQADALALATRLASHDGSELIVAHAYEWALMSDRLDAGHAITMRKHAQAVIDAAVADIGGQRFTTRVLTEGSVPGGLHELSASEAADVLVIGSCHRGPVGRTLIGGTGERIVHGSPCPVAVAPRGYRAGATRSGRIGIAFDGSPQSRTALTWATELAEATGGTLTVLQAFEPIWIPAGAPASVAYGYGGSDEGQMDQAQARLDEVVERLPAAVHAEGLLLRGPASHVLPEAAVGLDVLVVGSRAYGPLRSVLLGGVSRKLVRSAPCPLIVLPRSAAQPPEADAFEAVARAAAGD